MVHDITAEALQSRLQAGESLIVIDVREPHELEISSLPFARPIPMGEITARVGELDPEATTIVICRSGGRSMQVARFLDSRGFRSVSNLTGGILAWGERIDPSLRPY
jgi:adenylyltransferase/sulfurtransferase